MHSQFLSASYIILTPVSYHIYDFLNFNSSSCILNFFIRNYISWQVHFSFLLFLTVPYSISSLEKMMRNEYRTCVSIIFRKAFKQFIHFTCSQKTARQSTALMFFFFLEKLETRAWIENRFICYILLVYVLCADVLHFFMWGVISLSITFTEHEKMGKRGIWRYFDENRTPTAKMTF